MSLTTPEQPAAPGQDQQVAPAAAPVVPAAPAPAAPAAPPAGAAPWAADLNALFTDEATRGQVDQYLRTTVQPHVTQLEQQAAQSKDAQRLWDSLNKDPIDTYVQITTEMFGEEAGQQLLQTLQGEVAAQEAQQQAPPAQQQAPPVQDPRLAQVLQWAEQQQANQTYESELTRIGQQHTDVDVDLIHPFVAAANGDFDQAVTMYRQYYEQFAAKHGATPPPEVPAPVLGSDAGSAPVAPPVAPRNQSLDEAINDFMSENRANREAPPVSSV